MQKLEEQQGPIGAMRLRQRRDLKTLIVDGEMVVLDRQQGLIHQLNRSATCVWEQCDGRHTAGEISARLCEVFAVEQADALKDVLNVLQTLQELNLIGSI